MSELIDRRKVTLDATIDALSTAFPKKTMRKSERPLLGATQTSLFGGKPDKDGEIDIVLQ